ncbi:acyltransferase family protein [Colwellia sp. 12G3]|uniref:acyltransferase family protein n=1 Tax=Colwellia sp. 12G3 TaxID=2058299 RepID=UPI000C342A46|nr:acyltransferase [Colwellia sp. 12G3]PKI18170.1 acyltransferase [Colwellia sp. 12G3]
MRRLELLDYGRFFAAVIVVFFHYTFNGIANGKIESLKHVDSLIEFTKYGYLGVELFFMISGFVIFNSAKNRTPAEFALSRAIRLYPSYWFAVIFTSLFAWYWGGDLMSVTPSQIMMNFTLLQNYLSIDHVDGVYWTLVYEVKFYALVFFLLIIGLKNHLNQLFMLWPIAMLGAFITGHDDLPYLGGYFYYFSAGALFALLQIDKSLKNILSIIISFGLGLLYSTEQALVKSESMGVVFSEYIVGLIIICFFAFFIFMNTQKAQSLTLPLSKTLGALTYPVYLIHAHFGYMFISKYGTEENKFFIYIVTISIVLSVSYFMYRVIEVRLSTVWRRMFMSTLYELIIKIQCLPNKVVNVFNKLANASLK